MTSESEALFCQAVDMLEDLKLEGGLVKELTGSLMACISPQTPIAELNGIIDICVRREIYRAEHD